jgi:voltage-gated potassium channel
VTGEGRLMASGLMLSGIAVLGILTAGIAAWFVGQFHAVELAVAGVSDAVEEVAGEVEEVAGEVEDVERRMEAAERTDGEDFGALLAALRDISARLARLEQTIAAGRDPSDS